jgi:PAS domain S-box-containing protein
MARKQQGEAMSGLLPADLARIREKAERLNHAASHALPKITPHNVEMLVHELRVHQIELELQCQELQRAQVELEESRDRYRELYESIPIGYITIDSSGRIHDLNPEGMSLLGLLPLRKSSNNNFYCFLPSERDADAVTRLCRKVLSEQQKGSIEVRMKKIDDSVFTAILQAAPVLIGAGKGERVRIAFKDITRRREVEESLHQHQLELEANRVELQDLMSKLITAQEEERRRIACDLHDDHCQRITALILEASAMEKLVRVAMPSLMPRVGAIKGKLSGILDDFRHLTHELHPRHLDTVSLACSMRMHIKEFIEYTDLRVEFQERDIPVHLPLPITICLYRLLQESLGNIRKHAKAKQVYIGLIGGKQEVELSVSDDGSGFIFADSKKGLGLTSMQERVRPLRGHVRIDSQPGKGTTIVIRVPLPSGT